MPAAERPWMPDYPIAAGIDGLLSWEWALDRLRGSRSYWLATICPDGRPHVMPVWALWLGEALWFSCGPSSRKSLNLQRDPRATITTDDATEPVVVEGTATLCTDRTLTERFAEPYNAKYEPYSDGPSSLDFFLANSLWVLQPSKVLALREEDFTTSPTRWTF